MAGRFSMALDAGGGSGRCLLVNADDGTITTAARSWTHPAAPGTGGMGSDLDLEQIWARLAEAAREARERAGAAPEDVVGLATTSMRFGMVVLDGEDRSLYAGPNRDARAVVEALRLAAEHGEELYTETGHWPTPVSPAPRLLWLRDHDGAAWERARHYLSLSDWLAFRLCGERAAERSQAGESLLFGLERGDWASEWIERLGLPRELFPELRLPGSVLGRVTAAAAEALGVRPGIPVAMGGADTPCGLLGAGVTDPGQAAVVAGTTAPLQLVTEGPHRDPKGRLWSGCHVVEGGFVLESNAGAVGDSLTAFGRLLFPEAPAPAARLLAEAAAAEPGAGGVSSSAGAEIFDARRMGLPMGAIHLSPMALPAGAEGRQRLARALVEGLAYGLRANLEQLARCAGVEIPELHLGGGLSRSPEMARILAEVLGRPVVVATHPEATAGGAATCAAAAAGLFATPAEAARHLASGRRTVEPDHERSARYAELYAHWRDLRSAGEEADERARAEATRIYLAGAGDEPPPGPAVRPRMLATADLDDDALGALREIGEVDYTPFRKALRLLTGRSLVEALQGVEVFITEVDVVDAASLAELPDLRVVASCRGDAVNVDVEACTALGIPVLNTPGRNADAVADLTLAFLLMLARKLPEATAFLREPGGEAGDVGRMGRAFGRLRGRELWRKTVGLVGLGAVGRGVAQRLRPFGARVLVYDPFLPESAIRRLDAEPASLEALLAESDFVSLHAPVTDATRGLIDASALARMRPGACLVNTARAALVDEDALVETLERGHLGGAALDVFPVEPPGADHPLLAMDSVIATPHIGGNTEDVAAHQGAIVEAELTRLLRGEAPHHCLNPEVLESFDWSRPRPAPPAGTLERLAQRAGPAVTDLQKERQKRQRRAPDAGREVSAGSGSSAAAPAAAGATAASSPGTDAASEAPPRAVVEGMRRVLAGFVERVARDRALASQAEPREVTLHFRLADLPLAFWIDLRRGRVEAALGDPPAEAEVQLRLPADVLDGMLTGRSNPMQAAMDGRLSFSGDTTKAMSVQELQEDLSRCYREARDAAGDPGDLASLVAPGAAGAARPPAAVGDDDPRLELCRVVDELYTQQLITATGGNVSVRIPGRDELWITPSQLFKGDLRPEVLVRIDLEGRALDEGARSPSSERLMHCAVYKSRPDANAVIHAHAPHATILANTDLPFLPISTEAAFFGNLPRIPFVMPGTAELADAVGRGVAESWAVLMKNHGLLVAGRSLRRAADMTEIVERTSEVLLGCRAVGVDPPVLPEDVVTTLRKMGDLVA